MLSNRTRAANYTGVRLGNSIGSLVCAELVSGRGGVVGHGAGILKVLWCGLVGGADAELFLNGSEGFGHLVCLDGVVVMGILVRMERWMYLI